MSALSNPQTLPPYLNVAHAVLLYCLTFSLIMEESIKKHSTLHIRYTAIIKKIEKDNNTRLSLG